MWVATRVKRHKWINVENVNLSHSKKVQTQRIKKGRIAWFGLWNKEIYKKYIYNQTAFMICKEHE